MFRTRAHDHELMGLAHEHNMLVGRAHEHVLVGRALDHMSMEMSKTGLRQAISTVDKRVSCHDIAAIWVAFFS